MDVKDNLKRWFQLYPIFSTCKKQLKLNFVFISIKVSDSKLFTNCSSSPKLVILFYTGSDIMTLHVNIPAAPASSLSSVHCDLSEESILPIVNLLQFELESHEHFDYSILTA